jgi:hypothetical protein
VAHGRNHQQREAHVRSSRTKNTPESQSWETKLLASGRKRGMPPEGLIGAHRSRRLPVGKTQTMEERETAPEGGGSEVAPTARATAREKERHARERAVGRVAAGTMARRRGAVRPGLKRADLEAAARGADEKVGAAKKPRRRSR